MPRSLANFCAFFSNKVSNALACGFDLHTAYCLPLWGMLWQSLHFLLSTKVLGSSCADPQPEHTTIKTTDKGISFMNSFRFNMNFNIMMIGGKTS